MVLQHIKSVSLKPVNGIYAILCSGCRKITEVFKMQNVGCPVILLTL